MRLLVCNNGWAGNQGLENSDEVVDIEDEAEAAVNCEAVCWMNQISIGRSGLHIGLERTLDMYLRLTVPLLALEKLESSSQRSGGASPCLVPGNRVVSRLDMYDWSLEVIC